MPLDAASGVFHALHGPAYGVPLMITLPLMASHEAVFGPASRALLDGYLDRLTDRYRVLLVDYPSIGGSRDIAPHALSADRVCADLLAVASAAGFERFAYWGYSWSGAVGVQLACRSERVSALVIGGWAPLGALAAPVLQAAERKAPDPEPSSLVVLRNKAQYRQWIHFYRSLLDRDDAADVRAITCPRLAFFGSDGDLVEAGVAVPIASLLRMHRAELEALGWQVLEFPDQGHALTMRPDLVVPPVRDFLDRACAGAAT